MKMKVTLVGFLSAINDEDPYFVALDVASNLEKVLNHVSRSAGNLFTVLALLFVQDKISRIFSILST